MECINCNVKMEEIYEHCPKNERACTVVAWCPSCGIVLIWDDLIPEKEAWDHCKYYVPKRKEDKSEDTKGITEA